LGPDELDLQGFLDWAARLGGVLYLDAAPFAPDLDDASLPDDADSPGLPTHLTACKGQIGEIVIAFAANSVMHYWKLETAWLAEWEELVVGAIDGDTYGAERLTEEERTVQIAELADSLLADPSFRAASRAERWRLARGDPFADTDQRVAHEAQRQAFDRANQMAQERYDQLEGGELPRRGVLAGRHPGTGDHGAGSWGTPLPLLVLIIAAVALAAGGPRCRYRMNLEGIRSRLPLP
jgi:hypothetical protein